MTTAATDGDATERAIAAAEPLIDRAGTTSAGTMDRLVGSHEVAATGRNARRPMPVRPAIRAPCREPCRES